MIERHVFMEEAGAEGAGGGIPSPTPTASPEAPPGDSGSSDWRSSLPPELRDNPSLQDVTDVAGLAKRFVDTKAMVGNSLRIPTEEAGQEAIEAFAAKLLEHENLPLMRRPDPENQEAMEAVYRALGKPEDISGYAMPEGVDPEAFGTMANEAYALGLSKRQYETLAAKQAAMQNSAVKQMEEQRTASVAQVKGEWGEAFDQKVGRAAQIAEVTKAPAKLINALKAGGVDGETLRWLDTLATQLGTEGSPIAKQLDQVSGQTSDELRQRIAERTDRMLTEERMSPQERERLIQANVRDHETLAKYR